MHFLSAVTTFFGLILGPVHMEGGGVLRVGWGTSASRGLRNLAFTCSILNPGRWGMVCNCYRQHPTSRIHMTKIDPT